MEAFYITVLLRAPRVDVDSPVVVEGLFRAMDFSFYEYPSMAVKNCGFNF